MGRAAQLGEPMAFNQTCYGLRAGDEILDDFLYYAWKYKFHQIQAVSHGTVFDTITMASFDDIEIPLPDKDIQRKISSILGQLDDKIEVNNRTTEILDEIVQALFNYWFVDSSIQDEFETIKIGDICTTSGGGTPSTDVDEYWGGTHRWLTPKEVTSLDSPVVHDTERKLTEEGRNNSAAKTMPEDSILLTSRATVGEVVMNKEPMATNQGFICIRPNENLPPCYALQLVKSKRPEILSRASGSTYDEISQTSFNDITVALAPEEDRRRYEQIVRPLYDFMYNIQTENDRLREIRDTLLHPLLSGELPVSNINLEETMDIVKG